MPCRRSNGSSSVRWARPWPAATIRWISSSGWTWTAINVRADYQREFSRRPDAGRRMGHQAAADRRCPAGAAGKPHRGHAPSSATTDFPTRRLPHRFATLERALKRLGDEKAVILNLRDGFSDMRDLLGYEDALMGLLLEPTPVLRTARPGGPVQPGAGRTRPPALWQPDRGHHRRRRQRHRIADAARHVLRTDRPAVPAGHAGIQGAGLSVHQALRRQRSMP